MLFVLEDWALFGVCCLGAKRQRRVLIVVDLLFRLARHAFRAILLLLLQQGIHSL